MPDEKSTQANAAIYFLGAGVTIALLWAWFALEHLTDLRVVGASGTVHDEPIHVLLPSIGTPLALLGALFLWRRAAGIAANGVPVSATVKKVGGACQSMRDVEFSYTFEGREYSKKASVVTAISDELSPGDPLDVIVDKRNPKRVMVK